MVKKFDTLLSPDAFFALADRERDILFFEPNPVTWRAVDPAPIFAIPCSVHQGINDNVNKHIRTHFSKRRFSKSLEIRSLPVVLRKVRYEKSFASVGRKWILNGAAGTRLRNKYRNKNLAELPDIDDRVNAFFKQAHAKAPSKLPVVEEGFDLRPLGFAIECRNTFNFYHFLTETLGQLCVAVDLGVTGKVAIHSPSDEPARFVRRWVDELFPEFRGRVEFVSKPTRYDSVLSSHSMLHGYPYCSDAVMPSFDKYGGRNGYFDSRSAGRVSMGVLSMNAFDSSLSALRERGLRLSAAKARGNLPDRIWINRKSGGKRDRTMVGQHELEAALFQDGFTEVFLEDHSPLEQIALISNAKIIVGVHGAGLANMIFADRAATVIELGNAHTAHFRWGDFIRLTHVSGCTYTNFFADMAIDTPDTVDGLRSSDLPAVDFSADALDMLMDYIREVCGDGQGLKNKEQFRLLSEQFNFNGQFERILELHAKRPEWVASDPHLSSHSGNAYKAAGDLPKALAAIRTAHELEPKHGRIFEKMLQLLAVVEGAESARQVFEARKCNFPKQEERLRRVLGKAVKSCEAA